MDLDLMYFKKIAKSKRHRERNWDRNEKKALIRLVQRYRTIIDNKGNDNVWIRRKNAAWEAIQRGMAAEGFRRGIKSVRQQWARTKGEAKKKQTKVKNEKLNLDSEKNTPAAAIKIENTEIDPLNYVCKTEEYELEKLDAISIDDDDDADERKCEDENLISAESIMNCIPSPNFDNTESSGFESGTTCPMDSMTESSHRAEERKLLPSNPTSQNILFARLRQIEEETSQKAEIHSLEVFHRQELHALKVRLMHEQIEQQRKLFEIQMAKLKNSN